MAISCNNIQRGRKSPLDLQKALQQILRQILFAGIVFFLLLSPISPICFSSEVICPAIFPAEQISVERGQPRLSSSFFHVPQSQSRIRTWIRGFGNWSSIGGSEWGADVEYDSYGIAVGVDRQIGRNLLFGISLGGDKGSAKTKNGSYRWYSDISAVHTSLYCRMALQNIFFDLEGALGYDDHSLPSRTALQWNVNGEVGTWWTQGLGKVEPYLGLRYASLELEPDAESKTTLLLGVRYSWKTTGKYSVTSPRVYAGAIQELGGRKLLNLATFTDSPTVFSLPGYEAEQTRFFIGGGFTSSMGTSLDAYFRYTAEVASHFTSHTLLLGMNWNY